MKLGDSILCFVSVQHISKMSTFHHTKAIFANSLFSNPFSHASTNLSKGLALRSVRKAFTKSFPSSKGLQACCRLSLKKLSCSRGQKEPSLGWGAFTSPEMLRHTHFKVQLSNG